MKTDAIRIDLQQKGGHSSLPRSNFIYVLCFAVFHEYLRINPDHGKVTIMWTASNLLSVTK